MAEQKYRLVVEVENVFKSSGLGAMTNEMTQSLRQVQQEMQRIANMPVGQARTEAVAAAAPQAQQQFQATREEAETRLQQRYFSGDLDPDQLRKEQTKLSRTFNELNRKLQRAYGQEMFPFVQQRDIRRQLGSHAGRGLVGTPEEGDSARTEQELQRYAEEVADARVEQQKLRAQIREILAANDDYILNTWLVARAIARQRAQVGALLEIDDEYIVSRAAQVGSNKRIRLAVEKARQATEGFAQEEVEFRTVLARAETEILRVGREGGELADAMAARSAQRVGLGADVRERQRDDPGYLDELERRRVAGMEISAQEAQRLANNERARNARVNRLLANAGLQQQVNEEILQNQRGELNLLGRQRHARRELTHAVERQAINEKMAAAASQGIRPTRTQLLGARLREGSTGRPVDPLEIPTLRQGLTQKAFTAGQYAFAGIGIRQIIQSVEQLVDGVQKVETELAQLDGQMDAMGKGDQFEGVSEQLLGIARASGYAADEVVLVGRQMLGVFDEARGGVARAMEETEAAIRAAVVTGLPEKEIVDSLTAAVLAFGEQGAISIDDLTDKAIGLEERFGVLARESLQFFGDVGSVAAESGGDIDELAAVVGVLQQRLGMSGGAIGEQFSRVLSSVQSNIVEVISLFQRIPELAVDDALQERVQTAAATGRTMDVILILAENFDKLNEAQKTQVATQIGGERQYRVTRALLENLSDAVQKERDAESDTGAARRREARVNETLARTLARLRQEWIQLGSAILGTGIGEAINAILEGISSLMGLMSGLIGVFGDFNDILGGLPGRLIAIAVAARVMLAAFNAVRGIRGVLVQMQNVMANLATQTTATGAAAAAAGTGAAVGGATAGAVAAGGGLALRSGRLVGRGLRGAAAFGKSIAPIAIPLIGLELVGAISEVNRENEKQADELQAKVRAALESGDEQRIAVVRELMKNRESNAEKILGIFGVESVNDAVNEEVRKYEGEQAAIFAEGYFEISGPGSEELGRRWGQLEQQHGMKWAWDEFLEKLRSGDKEALALFNKIKAGLELTPAEQQRIADAIAGVTEEQRAAAEESQRQTDPGGVALAKTAEAMERYQQGTGTWAEYVEATQRELKGLRDTIARADPGKAPQVVVDAERELEASFRAAVAERVSQVAELQQAFAELRGATDEQVIQAELDVLIAALGDPDFGTQAQRGEAVQTIATRLTEQRSLRADAARTVGERQRVLDEQIILTAEQQRELFLYLKSLGVIDQKAIAPPPGGIGPWSVDALAPYLPTPGGSQDDKAATIELAQSQLDLDRSLTMDPVELARLERLSAERDFEAAKLKADGAAMNQAQARINQAKRQEREAAQSIEDARRNLQRARDDRQPDALRDARRAREDADRALQRAKDQKLGAVAELEAQAAQIEADRAIEDAMIAIGESRLNLLAAMAEAAGREAEAAQYNVRIARDALDRAVRGGAGVAEINALRAELVGASEAAAASRVSETQELIDFQLEMGEITVGQAIAQLTALLASPDVQKNEDRVRDIRRAIKGLQDQTSADLAFNIGELRIPTLYEVRRLGATATAGTGYNDNRQVSIEINVNNQGDLDHAVEVFSAAVNAPSRYGTAPRVYPSGALN